MFRNPGKAFVVAATAAVVLISAACAPDPVAPEGDLGANSLLLMPPEDAQEGVSPAPAAKETIKYIPDGTPGQHERHVLDLTLPSSGSGPFPLVIFLHGGAFAGGSKDDDPGASGSATSRGYALASIGYRLSGHTKFPGSFNDILTAIRFLRANADKYNLDPNRFAVTGFSAGGYHAGMVCVLSGAASHDLDGFPDLYPGVSNKVQACATYAGLSDMALLEEHEKQAGGNFFFGHGADSPEAIFLGINQALKDLPETPGSIRWRANPVNYISTNTPPLMMIHGSSDNIVPWVQSEYLVGKVNEKVPGRAIFDKQSGGHGGFSNRATQVFNFLDEKMPVNVAPPDPCEDLATVTPSCPNYCDLVPSGAGCNTSIRENERVIR